MGDHMETQHGVVEVATYLLTYKFLQEKGNKRKKKFALDNTDCIFWLLFISYCSIIVLACLIYTPML